MELFFYLASVYGNIPLAGPAQSNTIRHDPSVPPTGRAHNNVRGGEAPYERGDLQSGHGRDGYLNAPVTSPIRGSSGDGYHAANLNVNGDGQNISIYQTRPVGSLAPQNDPFLRPIRVGELQFSCF